MAASMKTDKLRVLELYSGIGGMHYALEESGISYEILEALDINPAACLVYRHNFPLTKVTEGLIEGALSVDKLTELSSDLIVMSPPCQPFTRVGMKRDVEDTRTNSFLYLLEILSSVPDPPKYILLENVKGFENSQAREVLVGTLQLRGYNFQEILLTPLQYGIPNCRLRYYLLAKLSPLKFSFQTQPEILLDIPECARSFLVHQDQENILTQSESCCPMCEKKRDEINFEKLSCTDCDCEEVTECSHSQKLKNRTECITLQKGQNSCDPNSPSTVGSTGINDHVIYHNLRGDHYEDCMDCCSRSFQQQYDEDHKPIPGCQILEKFLEKQATEYFSPFLLPDKDLKRFVSMDIVHPSVRKTTCFTRRYGNYIDGGGSFLQMTCDVNVVQRASHLKSKLTQTSKTDGCADWDVENLETVRHMQLRHFTPREIANLLCFPQHFSFPDKLTRRQMYKCLGNSLNVHVVSVLLRLLVMGDI